MGDWSKIFSIAMLDRITNVGLLVVSVAILGILIKTNFYDPRQASDGRPSQPVNIKGKKIAVPGLDFGASRSTLILALSSTCHFCNESMGFYKSLAASRTRDSKDLRIVAVFPQAATYAEEHLKSKDVSVDGVLSAPLASIGVIGTPTLILVDSKGVVQESWRGKLTAPSEKSLIGRLQQICPPCRFRGDG